MLQVPASRLRAAALAALVFTSATFGTAASPATTAAASSTPAQVVIAAAESHLGAPWVYAATGPYAFDCSGLVYAAFRDTGYFYVIGNGGYRTVGAMWNLFASRGLASTTDPQPGDLVVYGGGAHIGIYIGNGQVVSALVSGVAIHGLYAVTLPFTTFLHTGMQTPTIVETYYASVQSGPGYAYPNAGKAYPGKQYPIYAYQTDSTGRTWAQIPLSSSLTGWVPAWMGRNVGFFRAGTPANVWAGPGYGYSVVSTLAAGSGTYAFSSTSDWSRRVWLSTIGPAAWDYVAAGQTVP